MKKILLAALFGFVLLFNSYALTTWYSPYSASFSVDLKEAPGIYDGTTQGDYKDPNNPNDGGDYGQETMVGTIGATDFGASKTDDGYDENGICTSYTYVTDSIGISFDFSSASNWMYVSQADPSLSVPFGLDIVIRYRVQYNLTRKGWLVDYHDSATRDYTYSTSGSSNGVHQFGYQGENEPLDDGSRNINVDIDTLATYATDFRNEYNANNNDYIDHDIGSGDGDWKLDAYVIGIWVDIVPVIPEPTADQLKNIGSADDYMASYTINVGGAQYLVTMTGYYDSPAPKYGEVLFTVTPTANAYSLDIESMILDNAEVEIGEYSYTEEAEIVASGQEVNSPYYLFVSSSRTPTANGGVFTMMNVDAVTSTLNGRNGFKYKVNLVSDASGARSGDFNGEATIDSAVSQGLHGSSRSDSMIGNDGYSRTLYDNGKIVMSYVETDNVISEDNSLNLVSGEYVSDIYIHLVSVV